MFKVPNTRTIQGDEFWTCPKISHAIANYPERQECKFSPLPHLDIHMKQTLHLPVPYPSQFLCLFSETQRNIQLNLDHSEVLQQIDRA